MPSNSPPRIVVSHLHKSFKVYARPWHRFWEVVDHKPRHKRFTALEDVSFAVPQGGTVGIIGENGSGKSTLLKCIAGVLCPDAGSISLHGRVTGLLELGTGFNTESSGRKNITLNATYLRLSAAQIRQRMDDIIDFAELAHCIDQPLKSYSSGMIMRLAFAIAIHADPHCFLVDEALAVGDVYFQQKCFTRLGEFRQNGGAILFVSHDMNAVKLLCDHVILLHQGGICAQGQPDDMVNAYNQIMAGKANAHNAHTAHDGAGYGSNKVRLEGPVLLDAKGEAVHTLVSGASMRLCVRVAAAENVQDVSIGMLIRDRFGQDVFGVNGAMLGQLLHFKAHECTTLTFDLPAVNIGPGLYSITLAAHTGNTHLESCFHWLDNAVAFRVVHDGAALFSGHSKLEVRLSAQPSENTP